MKMRKIVLAAVLTLGLSGAAFAVGSFTCWYEPEPVQKLLLASFDPGGSWDIVRQNRNTLILANEVDPESVRYLMPMMRLPRRRPHEPDRWEREPVFTAEEYVTFNFREERNGL
ncbi:MAG: hypothetical protein IJ233_00950, partial [Pyramidobacter sp.]|nr:hypothetical protein [Pyramidobacter sp.]